MVNRYPLPPPPPPPDFLEDSSGVESGRAGNRSMDYRGFGEEFTIPPDGLVYLFPELFASTTLIGGFKSPYSGTRVSHHSLYKALVSVSLAYMLYTGVASTRFVSVGRIFKHDEIEVIKNRSRIPDSQPLLAYPLRNIGVGESLNLINLIGVVIGGLVEDPDKVYINRVGSLHVETRVDPRDRNSVARYKWEADRLYSLWMGLKQRNPLLYRVVEGNADRAYKKYRRVETEY